MDFPRPVRAVVFDMDGLLVDSEVLIRDLMIELAPQFGGHLPAEVFRRMVGLQRADSDAVARTHFGPDFPLAAFHAELARRIDAVCEIGVALKSGVLELLDHLDALEIPRAIATSSPHSAVRRTLGLSNVLPRFDAVLAAGDYARGKPYPDPFLAAAHALNVPPADCLALEDSHNGVRAAHAAGMMTVMVPDLLEPTDEMRERCVAIAQTLHEVVDALERPPRL